MWTFRFYPKRIKRIGGSHLDAQLTDRVSPHPALSPALAWWTFPVPGERPKVIQRKEKVQSKAPCSIGIWPEGGWVGAQDAVRQTNALVVEVGRGPLSWCIDGQTEGQRGESLAWGHSAWQRLGWDFNPALSVPKYYPLYQSGVQMSFVYKYLLAVLPFWKTRIS